MDTVGRLKQLLDSRGMSIYRLSQLSGISYSTIKNTVSRNGQLSLDTIERVCDALDIPLREFCSQQDSADREPPLTDGELRAVRGLLGAFGRRSTEMG